KDHMKKNLRIVSAAAAALLAVAPVAASAVSVNAATTIEWAGNVAENADVKVSASLQGVAASTHVNGNISGTITGTYNGQSYTANVENPGNIRVISGTLTATGQPATKLTKEDIQPGKYTVELTDGFGFNFSSANAGKTISILLPSNVKATIADGYAATGQSTSNVSGKVNVKLDKNGTVKFSSATISDVPVYSTTNVRSVNFYDNASGNIVKSGDLTINANSNYVMNVNAIMAAFNAKYQPRQLSDNDKGAQPVALTTTADSIKTQLAKEGMPVDDLGNFTANKSFTLNFAAKSAYNDYSTSMDVTVNVPNGKDTTVPSQSKNIMHNAYYYDKDAKRVGTDKVTRYNSVTVAMNTTTIKGKAYYEVIENGKATGKFINADNIDGTKRTLKHNAYVYKSSKKRANKVTLKKGTEVTTYGGTYTFKNGKQYYKIGDNTEKTYVKASNF
uniref:SLAP domain-containing protein n=1 Tax=uncultured Lactobacillus sp. TaxID=153152 RepID=UPI0026167962